MSERRDACIAFVRMAHAQLPVSEYTVLRQLLQKLTGGLSSAQEVHDQICTILRHHDATELLAHFERLMMMGRPHQPSLLLLRQPCGVYLREGVGCTEAPHACHLPRLRVARSRREARAAARGSAALSFCARHRARVRG